MVITNGTNVIIIIATATIVTTTASNANTIPLLPILAYYHYIVTSATVNTNAIGTAFSGTFDQ